MNIKDYSVVTWTAVWFRALAGLGVALAVYGVALGGFAIVAVLALAAIGGAG